MSDAVNARFGLGGRRALVTGARSGIGAAAAEALAAAGADLVLWGRTEDSVRKTADTCRAHGREVAVVGCDLSDARQVGSTARALAEEHRIDVLVNNAGTISRAPAAEVSYETWRSVLVTNLDSVFVLSREIGGAMVRRGGGAIVNITSLLSFQGGINVAAYAASKHALAGLTKALANEWAAHDVTVNAVAPGYIATDNTAALRADPRREPEIRSRIPAGRWGTPDDVSGAVVFLAGPAARYITGHTLVVDGGWLAR
ncbi:MULTISPECIES: SDR family oxidoreductase [unclassified Streptomyces]|uniref:SDR family oxidoreductase n=1 Tax=unclassified Streptomyces TaxID=2593676 RepID=UPI003418AD03